MQWAAPKTALHFYLKGHRKDGTMSAEEPIYKTISEAALEIGIARPSMYHYIKILGIETKRFKLSREKFISAQDVERIKQVREKPWLAGERPAKEDASQPLACSLA